MKKIIAFLIIAFFIPQFVFGAGLTFRWQQELVPDLAGWTVLRSDTAGGTYTEFADIPFVAEQTVYTTDKTVSVPDDTVTKIYFKLYAYDTHGNPSPDTPEIMAEIDTRDLEGPPMPINFEVIINP